MKNIRILIIVLFAFCAKVAVAQNLTFSYSVTNTGNTSKVKIFTQNTSSTSEVLASFNAYFYYNNKLRSTEVYTNGVFVREVGQ